MPKPDKDSTKQEKHRPVSFVNIDKKNLSQNMNQQNSTLYRKNYTPDQMGFISGA